jgi:hypothetical protein
VLLVQQQFQKPLVAQLLVYFQTTLPPIVLKELVKVMLGQEPLARSVESLEQHHRVEVWQAGELVFGRYYFFLV